MKVNCSELEPCLKLCHVSVIQHHFTYQHLGGMLFTHGQSPCRKHMQAHDLLYHVSPQSVLLHLTVSSHVSLFLFPLEEHYSSCSSLLSGVKRNYCVRLCVNQRKCPPMTPHRVTWKVTGFLIRDSSLS